MDKPNIAIFTPTRHPGIAVSYYSVARQTTPVNHWLVADQLATERPEVYKKMRKLSPNLNIETYQAEILPGNVSNLAHVDNWALRRARELNVDVLIFLQDFIWMPPDGAENFYNMSKVLPFCLLTGNCRPSKLPKPSPIVPAGYAWNIFSHISDCKNKPRDIQLDNREKMGMKTGYVSNHAWEVNYGALPHAFINAGIDFDEDYDVGTQWENTQFSFDIHRAFRSHLVPDAGRVWYDTANCAIGMPHRDYFPRTHEGELDVRNDALFWQKNPDLIGKP